MIGRIICPSRHVSSWSHNSILDTDWSEPLWFRHRRMTGWILTCSWSHISVAFNDGSSLPHGLHNLINWNYTKYNIGPHVNNVVLLSLKNQYTTWDNRITGCELHFTPREEQLKRTRSFADVTTVTHILVVNSNIERGKDTHCYHHLVQVPTPYFMHTTGMRQPNERRWGEWLFRRSRDGSRLIAPVAALVETETTSQEDRCSYLWRNRSWKELLPFW